MRGKSENKLNSYLGSGCEFEGELKVKGVLRIDGVVKGNIQADHLILSETADVKGELLARSIVVGGRAEGILKASELVEIQAKGRVKGDVITDKFVVAKGGDLNGRIEMKEGESKVLSFDSSAQESSAT
jgi:cytoskeletal protein CcmA (bactofilin family)